MNEAASKLAALQVQQQLDVEALSISNFEHSADPEADRTLELDHGKKLGSLCLTSFMQEVTHVRALEGELARTIQLMRGVKAARLHIVMADEGSFRHARQH